jgi:hypothetical protein
MLYKDKKVLIHDNGLFPYLAPRLSEDFGEVFYHTECGGASPTPDKSHIGFGLENITRVDSFEECLMEDKPDLIVFPDVGDGDKQVFLRSVGYRVFGSGKGEILEQDRVFLRKCLSKLGLPVAPYKVVTNGIDSLRDELAKAKNKFVKISYYRGIGETFKHDDYDKKSKFEINRIANVCGALDSEVEFVIEDPIESDAEFGAEWFFADDGFLPVGMFGPEVKNKGYCGKVCDYKDLPKPLKLIMEKFTPLFKKYKVRGALSTEVRITKDGKPYFIDPCMRFGSPPGEVLSEAYENMAEIMWNVAEGKSVTPKPKAKYWAQIMLQCREAATYTMPINFDPKMARNLKFRYLCKIKNQHYYLPQAGETIIGAAIGWGETLKIAQNMAIRAAESVEAGDVFWDKDVFDMADEQIKKGEKFMGVF